MLAAYAALLAQDAMRDKMRHELQALEFDRLGDAARDRLIATGRTPDDGLWDSSLLDFGLLQAAARPKSELARMTPNVLERDPTLEASRAEEAERAAAERSAGGGGGGGGGFNPDNRSSVSAASDRPSVTLEMPPSTQSPVGRGSVVATEQAMSQDV